LFKVLEVHNFTVAAFRTTQTVPSPLWPQLPKVFIKKLASRKVLRRLLLVDNFLSRQRVLLLGLGFLKGGCVEALDAGAECLLTLLCVDIFLVREGDLLLGLGMRHLGLIEPFDASHEVLPSLLRLDVLLGGQGGLLLSGGVLELVGGEALELGLEGGVHLGELGQGGGGGGGGGGRHGEGGDEGGVVGLRELSERRVECRGLTLAGLGLASIEYSQ